MYTTFAPLWIEVVYSFEKRTFRYSDKAVSMPLKDVEREIFFPVLPVLDKFKSRVVDIYLTRIHCNENGNGKEFNFELSSGQKTYQPYYFGNDIKTYDLNFKYDRIEIFYSQEYECVN